MKSSQDQSYKTVARVLLYKRTHIGDPNADGCFGINDCMKSIRNWRFDAVIGIGGIRPNRDDRQRGHKNSALVRKINWIGIGRKDGRRIPGYKGPLLYFRKFKLFGNDGTQGPFFAKHAPKLAHRMYDLKHPPRQLLIDKTMRNEWTEIEKVLELARRAESSRKFSRTSQDAPIQDACRQRKKNIC